MDRLDASIERGLQFLRRNQLPSGEFKVYRSRDKTESDECVVDSTPFASAMVAYSLGFAQELEFSKGTRGEVEEMLRNVTRFLLAEREEASVWRYWTKAHPHHAAIPPDLDDTAYVSEVLRRQGAAFPSNEDLMLLNRNPEGLFYTWLAPRLEIPPFKKPYWRVILRPLLKPLHLYYFWKMNESGPNDIDGVVNANVLFYLGDSPAARPVVKYLMDIVHQNREECCDKWHLNRFTFYYAVSRSFYAGLEELGAIRDEVIRRIESAVGDGGVIGQHALDTGLAACALLNWKSDAAALDNAINFLIESQGENGGWPHEVLYYGGPKRYYGWGSEELTTGFCLEALMRYRKNMETLSV